MIELDYFFKPLACLATFAFKLEALLSWIILFFASLSIAQDTLFIASSQFDFNPDITFNFNDTLDLDYNTSYEGMSETINIKTKINVFNSAGWNNNVEDKVLISSDTSQLSQLA